MPGKPFAATLAFSVLALLAVPSLCDSFESIEFVTKERAKELGLELTPGPAGPDAMLITLAFETRGELKSFHRVALDAHEDGKLLLASTLKNESTEAGRVVVSFAVDRAKLDRFELKVVTFSDGERTGYVLRLKEFVDPAKVR